MNVPEDDGKIENDSRLKRILEDQSALNRVVNDIGPLHSQPNKTLESIDDQTIKSLATIFGYQLIEMIGSGGSGIVYKARKINESIPNAYDAIKIGLNSNSSTALFDEAKKLSTFTHPNIVALKYCLHDPQTNSYCLVMPYIKDNLASYIKSAANQRLGWRIAVDIVYQVALGLHHIHTTGRYYAHSDIKPLNILIDQGFGDEYPNGIRALIADIEFAKFESLPLLEDAHSLLGGTSKYGAPEYFKKPPTVYPQSDIFSLGIIAYEMVSGSHPFPIDGDKCNSYSESIVYNSQQSLRYLSIDNSRDFNQFSDLVDSMLAKNWVNRPRSWSIINSLKSIMLSQNSYGNRSYQSSLRPLSITVVDGQSITVWDGESTGFPWQIQAGFKLEESLYKSTTCLVEWKKLRGWAEKRLQDHLYIVNHWKRLSGTLKHSSSKKYKSRSDYDKIVQRLYITITSIRFPQTLESETVHTLPEKLPVFGISVVQHLYKIGKCYEAIYFALLHDDSVGLRDGTGHNNVDALVSQMTDWLFESLKLANSAIVKYLQSNGQCA